MKNYCDNCRYWSDTIARVKDGWLEAICMNCASPKSGKYTRRKYSCIEFESGVPIDRTYEISGK